MGLSKKLSCESGSFSHHCNPHRFLQSGVLKLYFSALEPWVVPSISLPSCSSWFIRIHMWDCLVCQLPPSRVSFPPQLPVSTPPASLNECFFFNSLVVRLYIVWFSGSSGYILFLNLALSFWLCKAAQCIYLRLHLGWESGSLLSSKIITLQGYDGESMWQLPKCQ